jgi:VWFA-related protein
VKIQTILFAVAVGALVILVQAQAQEPTERFIGEATVNLIEVPVRVIDPSTGEPVTGLTMDDFRVLENGIEQRVTNFNEIGSRQVVGPIRDERTVSASARAGEPEAKPIEIIYFFDLYLMYKRDRDRAIEGLREQFRTEVPEDINVSVVAYDGVLETMLDRSEHNEDVLDALEEVQYLTARGPQQTIAFSQALTSREVSGQRDIEYYERRQRSQEYFFELEKKVMQVGDALAATMARYARADGRRVLVAFTPGYPRVEWAPEYSPVDFVNASVRYPTDRIWENLAHEAADLGFTLYTVDSSGVSVLGGVEDSYIEDAEFSRLGRASGRTAAATAGGAAIGAGTVGDPTLASVDPNAPQDVGAWIERNRKELLITASASTGGSAIFASDVTSALDRVNSALDHYYSLGYIANHSGDGEDYSIEVKIEGHPEYRLVHRTGYIDQPASMRAAQRLRSEMLFGEDANPLAVRVEIGEPDSRFRMGAAGSKRVKVPIQLKIPYARLEMVPRGDLYWGKVMITFFGTDQTGNQSRLAGFEQPITIDAKLYQEAVQKGYFGYEATVEIEGGTQQVFIGIEDAISGRISIMPQEFKF